MFNEDNSGFINFPYPSDGFIKGKNVGQTLVYLVAFEPKKSGDISNISINMPGLFSSDDVLTRPDIDYNNTSLDNLVDIQDINNKYDEFYFPNINSEDDLNRCTSIKLVSAICVGWADLTFEWKGTSKFWNATFRDLTNEGQRLYYSIKKLHNTKEVRLLTFNHI